MSATASRWFRRRLVADADHADTARGAAEALGLVLIFPVIVGLAMLVLWLGRQVDTNAQVQSASSAAALAAARQRTPAAGIAAAQRTAASMLTDSTACTGGADVTIDASSWRPGGSVSVTVTCVPRRDDLALAVRARSFTASATATIDPYQAPGLP